MSHSLKAELAECSPIVIQNSSNPSSQKNLDVWPYNHTTVQRYDHSTIQGATFNMRGQLYHGHANATALFSSPVVSALGSESDDLGSSPGWDKVLCPWDVQEKKMQVPLLGLVKSICYLNQLNVNLLKNKLNTISVCTKTCKGTTWMDILTNVSKDRTFSNQVRSWSTSSQIFWQFLLEMLWTNWAIYVVCLPKLC